MIRIKRWLQGFGLGALLGGSTVAVAAAVAAQTVDTMLLVQIFTFVALIAGFIRQWLSEGRAHKWALDREAIIAAELKRATEEAKISVTAQANSVAMTLAANATALATKVSDTAERLASKVEAGTERAVNGSERAFTEANSTNIKIKSLQEALLDIGKSLVALHEHVERTETQASRAAAVAEQTRALNDKVDEIIQGKIDMRIRQKKR